MRRLLSLDYVIEHSDLPWLPTEHEKVGALEALGIERRILPVKAYRGAAGTTRRYFPVKLPVALDAGAPSSSTPIPATRPRPRSARGAMRTGGSGCAQGAGPIRRGRGRRPPPPGNSDGHGRPSGDGPNTAASSPATPEPGRAARCDIDRIEQAIRGMDDAVIEKHGGLQGCLQRIVELKDLLRSSRPGTTIDGFTTWRSIRLPHVAGRVAVAPRPPGAAMPFQRVRPWRERPPLRDAWYGIGEGWMCTPIHPPSGGRSGPAIPCGKAIGHLDGRVPDLAAWTVARAIGGTRPCSVMPGCQTAGRSANG